MEDNPGRAKMVQVVDRVFPKSKFILITDELAISSLGLKLSCKTLRKYHYLRKFSNLIVKILGRLYINLEEWEKLIDAVKKRPEDSDNMLKGIEANIQNERPCIA